MSGTELFTWLALWLTPSVLIFAWVWADEWLACREDDAHTEVPVVVVPDWDANVAAFDALGVTR